VLELHHRAMRKFGAWTEAVRPISAALARSSSESCAWLRVHAPAKVNDYHINIFFTSKRCDIRFVLVLSLRIIAMLPDSVGRTTAAAFQRDRARVFAVIRPPIVYLPRHQPHWPVHVEHRRVGR